MKTDPRPFIGRLERLQDSRPFWWILCGALGLLQAWTGRYCMTGDGMSYLDIAVQTLAVGPHALINGYWSPVYPALIAAGLWIFRPSPAWEFPLIHIVNFAVFIAVVCSFTFFLRCWRDAKNIQRGKDDSRGVGTNLTAFGFGVFLWCMLEFIPLSLSTPDLGVAATVFLLAGICCKIAVGRSRMLSYVLLGLVLALGYFIKAAMLPLGLLLLGTLLVFRPTVEVRRRGILAALAVFLIVASPYIALLSVTLGHFTTGESGPFNYAWYVNRLTADGDWVGEPGSPHGTPRHPPRVLSEKPFTLEFASPVPGTYPLWYDPAYWYAGATPHFQLRQQLMQMWRNLRVITIAVMQAGVLICGLLGALLAMACSGKSPSPVDRPATRNVWLFVWSLGATAMYYVVHVDMRFLGAFVVLFALEAYDVSLEPLPVLVQGVTRSIVLLSLLIPLALNLVTSPILHPPQADDWNVARQLTSMGIKRGDRVAIVGTGYRAYWARSAGVQIVAQVREWTGLSQLQPSELSNLTERMSRVGVKALVIPGEIQSLAGHPLRAASASDTYQFSVLILKPES